MKRVRKKKDSRFPDPGTFPNIYELRKWKDDYVRQVYYLSLLGATDMQISQVFGVGTDTIAVWKRNKPEFLKSMNKGKLQADAKVSYSLFLAAVGYSHPDQVVLANKKREYDPVTGKLVREWTEPLIVDTVKNYPPNVTAAIKWLQARQPEQWGKKIQLSGHVDHLHKFDLSGYSEEELEVMKKLGIQYNNSNIEDVGYENLENQV